MLFKDNDKDKDFFHYLYMVHIEDACCPPKELKVSRIGWGRSQSPISRRTNEWNHNKL